MLYVGPEIHISGNQKKTVPYCELEEDKTSTSQSSETYM